MKGSVKRPPMLPSKDLSAFCRYDLFLMLSSVIIASGLIALVDDWIKRRWHQQSHLQLALPNLARSSSKEKMDYVGPKRLVDQVFKRKGKQAARHPTPLLQTTF